MFSETALKLDFTEAPTSEKVYVDNVRERLSLEIKKRGTSQNRLATKSGLGSSTISLFARNKYPGDNIGVARKLEPFLEPASEQKKDISGLFGKNSGILLTSVVQKMWIALQIADQGDIVDILGPSGIGKSETLKEYKRQEESPLLITVDITTRTTGPVLDAIGRELEIGGRVGTQSHFLTKIIKILKLFPRTLMFDESHFLTWESLELIRTIHDCARVGVVFAGQERFYEQMRGSRRSYLFDQLLSRIGCHCRVTSIEKKDVKLLCDALYPDLNKQCLEFLFTKASGPGKFRTMTKVLQRAIRIAEKEKVSIDLDILREANSLLLL